MGNHILVTGDKRFLVLYEPVQYLDDRGTDDKAIEHLNYAPVGDVQREHLIVFTEEEAKKYVRDSPDEFLYVYELTPVKFT